MAAFSTVDALTSLYTSIPDWSTRLDELNGQIALRQIELAKLEDERQEHAIPRSLRNKGSTESLRPKDGSQNNISAEDAVDPTTPAQSKTPIHLQFTKQASSKLPDGRATAITPPPSKPDSTPRTSPNAALIQQSSQSTPITNNRLAPAVLKKRKTESLASGESVAPKYRTRSMIIVYYDSAVQTAFEDLVKFVSGSRNAMRKGKMAAKMAEMRRAAELEADNDADEDGLDITSPALLAAQKKAAASKTSSGLVPGRTDSDDGDFSMPKLKFVSTRNMGPSRDYTRTDNFGSTLSVGMLRGYRRGGSDGAAPDIFDQLDKGLEWCQSQCEHAAHQFLRDGECSQEIENIKKKLLEVREGAGKEVERLKSEESEAPPKPVRRLAASSSGKARELKSVQMRKDLGSSKALEADDMEVDEDEGLEDMEPPQLVFKRSRDVSIH